MNWCKKCWRIICLSLALLTGLVTAYPASGYGESGSTQTTRLASSHTVSQFTRATNAYNPDTATETPTNQPRRSAAGAVLVEEGTTNRFPTTLKFTLKAWNATDGGIAQQRLTGGVWRVNRINPTSGRTFTEIRIENTYSVTAGETLTQSFYFQHNGSAQDFQLSFTTPAGTKRPKAVRIADVAPGWKRAEATYQVQAGETGLWLFHVLLGSGNNWTYLDIKNFQIEVRNYATTYSSLSRAADTWTVPTQEVFHRGAWTVEMEYRPTSNQAIAGRTGQLWNLTIDQQNGYALRVSPEGRVYLAVKSGGTEVTTLSATQPALQQYVRYRIAARGDGSTMALFLDGIKLAEVSYSEPVGWLPSTMYIGSSPSSTGHANGYFGHVRFSSRVRTDQEIADELFGLWSIDPQRKEVEIPIVPPMPLQPIPF